MIPAPLRGVGVMLMWCHQRLRGRMEIFPGIHRSESDLGERFMCQYLLVGGESTVLVDTGLAGTPGEVIVPYLEGIGLGVEDLDEVIISHADVDHCGGNSALEEMNPALRFSRGEADRAFVESADRMMAEIYLWSEPYGFGPDEESRTWLRTELGGDSPVDTGLRGGETLRLGPQWRIEVLHLPGHTPGHLGIWDEGRPSSSTRRSSAASTTAWGTFFSRRVASTLSRTVAPSANSAP